MQLTRVLDLINTLIIKYLNNYFHKELIFYPAFDIEYLYDKIQ